MQRRATKLLPELSHLSYTDRLKKLNIPSLKVPTFEGRSYTFIQNCPWIIYIESTDFFRYSHVKSTRGDVYKIFIEGCSSNVRKNYFVLFRTVSIWNSLKFETKNAATMNSFKNAVDRELFFKMFDYDEWLMSHLIMLTHQMLCHAIIYCILVYC